MSWIYSVPPVSNASLRILFNARESGVVKKAWDEAEKIVKAQTAVSASIDEPRRILVVSLLTAGILIIGVGNEKTELADVDAFLFTRDKSYKDIAHEIRTSDVGIEPIRRFIQGVGNQLFNLTDRSRDPVFMALNAVLYDLRISATHASKFQTYGAQQG